MVVNRGQTYESTHCCLQDARKPTWMMANKHHSKPSIKGQEDGSLKITRWQVEPSSQGFTAGVKFTNSDRDIQSMIILPTLGGMEAASVKHTSVVNDGIDGIAIFMNVGWPRDTCWLFVIGKPLIAINVGALWLVDFHERHPFGSFCWPWRMMDTCSAFVYPTSMSLLEYTNGWMGTGWISKRLSHFWETLVQNDKSIRVTSCLFEYPPLQAEIQPWLGLTEEQYRQCLGRMFRQRQAPTWLPEQPALVHKLFIFLCS